MDREHMAVRRDDPRIKRSPRCGSSFQNASCCPRRKRVADNVIQPRIFWDRSVERAIASYEESFITYDEFLGKMERLGFSRHQVDELVQQDHAC